MHHKIIHDKFFLYRTSFTGLPPGVNFINVLGAAFTRADPKSAKKDTQVVNFFALLGSVPVKAARKTLMKLTPGVRSKMIIFESLLTKLLGGSKKWLNLKIKLI